MAKANVVVRMYNVGFGDAFLLLFPGHERPRRVLIDCGMHSAGPGPRKMKEVVKQIIRDVTDPDGASRIDVVVCTHRHQDHVSGFASALWDNVEVGEVWMPWTEDPTDRRAGRIRRAQSTRAQALTLALARLGADEGMQAMARNSLTNAPAMRTLHKRFMKVDGRRALRRYLPTKVAAERSFTSPVLTDVEVHVLGPSRKRDVIRDMEPQKGESYLQFLMSRAGPPAGRVQPFREGWALGPATYAREYDHLVMSPHHRIAFKKVGSGAEFDLVTKLDKAVNGTSLMLMFVQGAAHLLFSGDAQWGTWMAALADPEWKDLLSRTTFYKVGHHGSHNATPRAFVDKHLSKAFLAMVSTRRMKRWPNIPRKPLLAALRVRSNRVCRSDRRDVPDGPEFVRRNGYLEARVPV